MSDIRSKGKKNRKHDRNERWCENYRARQQRERNKARRLSKHLKKYPGDGVARVCLSKLSAPATRAAA